MAHDVFISHSSKDKKVADAVCAALEAVKIRCWVAPRDILAGEIWQEAISRAIEKSHIMVLIFSSNSNSSKDVSKELVLAMNVGVAVIPLKIENVEPSGVMKYYLSDTHWIDSLNPPTKDQIDNIVETVSLLVYKEKINSGEKKISAEIEKGLPHDYEREVPVKKTKFFKSNKLAIILGLVLLAAIVAIVFIVIVFNNKINETKVAVSETSTQKSAKETMAAEIQKEETAIVSTTKESTATEITKGEPAETTETEKETTIKDEIISSIIGSCDTPGNAHEVYVQENYAYVGAEDGLHIIDITDKKDPNIVGSCKIGGIYRVYIDGNYAYTSNGGLQIIDITDKKDPKIISNMSGNSSSAYIVGNYAYVAGVDGLQIIDITDKKNPYLIGNYEFSEYILTKGGAANAWDVYIEGDYAYIMVGSSDKVSLINERGLQIIDITDKKNPNIVGRYETSGFATRIYVEKNYAYVADNSLQIIDITDKKNPINIGSTSLAGWSWDIQVEGNYAYSSSGGLQIIDITDKKNPVNIGSCKTPGGTAGIFVEGNYAYIADNEKGLQIIDASIWKN